MWFAQSSADCASSAASRKCSFPITGRPLWSKQIGMNQGSIVFSRILPITTIQPSCRPGVVSQASQSYFCGGGPADRLHTLLKNLSRTNLRSEERRVGKERKPQVWAGASEI